jgi:hypothetical protein
MQTTPSRQNKFATRSFQEHLLKEIMGSEVTIRHNRGANLPVLLLHKMYVLIATRNDIGLRTALYECFSLRNMGRQETI